MRQLVYTMFITNTQTSFHLWRKENLANYQTVSKFYNHHCRPRHERKYTKCKMCFSIMMAMCIKQHLSNIWSTILGKVKQHWGLSSKKTLPLKKIVYSKASIYVIQTGTLIFRSFSIYVYRCAGTNSSIAWFFVSSLSIYPWST